MKKMLTAAYVLAMITGSQIVAAGVMSVLGLALADVYPAAGVGMWIAVGIAGVGASIQFLRGMKCPK